MPDTLSDRDHVCPKCGGWLHPIDEELHCGTCDYVFHPNQEPNCTEALELQARFDEWWETEGKNITGFRRWVAWAAWVARGRV